MPSKRPPLWKQLVGGIGGAVVALALYQAYVVASPAILAAVVAPATGQGGAGVDQASSSSSSSAGTDAKDAQIAAQARALAQQLIQQEAGGSASSSAAASSASVGAVLHFAADAGASSSARSLPALAAPETFHHGAPLVASAASTLPQSGVGDLAFGLALAFAATALIQRRRVLRWMEQRA